MAIVGTGIDLARIPRFRQFVDDGKTALLERLFTSAEREYSLAHKDPASHLAVRFAAKESFLKALGTGLRFGLSWQQIEVVRDELGRPSLRLSGRALEMMIEKGASRTHLSYSHDGDYGVASVILETE
jgi:holo-[acyl-carrier protein] synthase